MSNPADVSLFEQGVDAWNAVLEHRLYGGRSDSRDTRHAADLSGESLGHRAGRRWGDTDHTATFDTLISYPQAEFGWCDLRGTDFSAFALGYDFRAANFYQANLQNANLSGADLQNARFRFADLRGAALRGARLDRAELAYTDLIGADLAGTSPWRALLFRRELPDNNFAGPGNSTVGSVSDLIEVCSDLRQQNTARSLRFYFRGEARLWRLRPSVMRSLRLRNAEGHMLTELITSRPHDFSNVGHAIDQWVLAQHHGLQTRLLDVTRNPLVALFFACESLVSTQADGRLHIFAVPPSLVKPYNSDSVSIVANFAKLSFSEQSTLLGKRRESTWDYKGAMRKLYHFIGDEKPHFSERIDPRDLFRVFVVEPKHSFEKIGVQSGAFLVSAFHERFERETISRCYCGTPVYEHFTLTIPTSAKPKIIEELRLLNITRDTLFPSLAEAANAATVRQLTTRPSDDRKNRRRVSHPDWDYAKRPLPPDRTPRILELGRQRFVADAGADYAAAYGDPPPEP